MIIMTKYKRTYPSYKIAKLSAQETGLTSKKAYQNWCRDNQVTHIPFEPSRVYKDEWEGWAEYLGTGNVLSKKIKK